MAKICTDHANLKWHWRALWLVLASSFLLAFWINSLALAAGSVSTAQPVAATAWVKKDRYARARLVAGRIAAQNAAAQMYAGVEIALADGWKTYWRTSGDAAGVPPFFNFKGSTNLASAQVLYPAPHRFKTPDGDSIGYKRNVTFPIRLIAKDAAKPITVKLKLFYGVCSDICIPAEANFNVTMRKSGLPKLDTGPLVSALADVPRLAKSRISKDPVLKTARSEGLGGKNPRIILDVIYPGGLKGADLFVEGPDEAYVPQPQRLGKPSGNRVRYAINLSHGADIAELKGKPLRLTLVSDAGQSELSWVLK